MKKYYLLLLFTSLTFGQSLRFAAKFGGGQHDICTDVAVDQAGNVYAVGTFKGSVDFDPGPGIYNINELNTATGDLYCVKLNRDGQLVWAMPAGGAHNYSALDELTPVIALDPSGNVLVAGHYQNTVDMNPGLATLFLPPVSELASTGNFISKFSSLSGLIWCKRWGGQYGFHWNREIKTDAAGNIYVAGYFQHELEFDGPVPFYLVTDPAKNNGYIAKLNPNGDFLWAIQIGTGTYDDYIRDMDVDAAGNIVVTGSYRGTVDFDPSEGEHFLSSQMNGGDIFVAKYTTDGELQWAHTFGRLNSSNAETGDAVTFDPSGNIIATGTFRMMVDFNPAPGDDNVFNLETVGNGSQFFLKLSPEGEFIWANTIGAMSANGTTDHTEKAFDITTDADGNIHVVGHYVGQMDADPGEGVFYLIPEGGSDAAFNLKLDPQGNFLWARSMDPPGTNYNAHARSIAVNPFGEVVVGGRFQGSVNFNPGGTPFIMTAVEPTYDSFVMSLFDNSLNTSDFADANISVHPNPTSDLLYINGIEVVSAEFVDASGRIVLKSSGNVLSTSSLQNGIYFLRIASADGIRTFKIVRN